jgi:glutamate racemase
MPCVIAEVTTRACPLFVALAEEGWTDGDIVEAISRRYLEPIFAVPESQRPDVLVLGCTHFPALSDSIRRVAGEDVTLVDSAETAARFARVGGRFFGQTLAPEAIEIVDL